MNINNVWEGNIIFDVLVRGGDKISASDMELVVQFSDVGKEEQIARALTDARVGHLQLLEMTTSYGAHGAVLFESMELTEP